VLLGRGFGPLRRLTPDGRHLVAAVLQPRPGVQIRPLDTTAPARDIATDRIRNGPAEVSPDGQWLAYDSFDDSNQPSVVVCDIATCSSKRTLPAMPRWRWMPDSRALAAAGSGRSADLWMQPLDGRPRRQLTHFANDGRQIADFAWSADGKRLAVARTTQSNDIVMLRGFRGSSDR
jgi:Tol biopolymer transport system component